MISLAATLGEYASRKQDTEGQQEHHVETHGAPTGITVEPTRAGQNLPVLNEGAPDARVGWVVGWETAY